MSGSENRRVGVEVLIAKGARKRRIAMPFGVCGSREAVEALRDACQRFLDDPGNGCGISYGWFRVEPPPSREWVYGPAGTKPEAWEPEALALEAQK